MIGRMTKIWVSCDIMTHLMWSSDTPMARITRSFRAAQDKAAAVRKVRAELS